MRQLTEGSALAVSSRAGLAEIGELETRRYHARPEHSTPSGCAARQSYTHGLHHAWYVVVEVSLRPEVQRVSHGSQADLHR
jgi:hypothetical protein